MKRGAIRLTVIFALATSSLSCCGGKDTEIARLEAELRHAKQAVARAADDDREKTRPKLWLDKDAAESIRLLGYDHVYVIRYQHGEVEGWVEFDEEGVPKQIPLDSKPKQGEKRDAAEQSGSITIALLREKKSDGPQTPTDTFQIQMGFDAKDKNSGSSAIGIGKSAPIKVKMDPNPNAVTTANTRALGGPFGGVSDNNQIVLKRFVDQKDTTWLKLKLVEK